MLDGKIVDGRWEPGRINRLLGRNLECGEYSWYQRLHYYLRDEAWFDFKTRVLRWDWYVEYVPSKEADWHLYDFKSGMRKRQAEQFLNSLILRDPPVDADAWIARDRPIKR